MSTSTLARPVPEARAAAGGHRLRLRTAYAAAVVLILSLAVYGFDFYTLSADARPFSPKYELLKPSGVIGLKLGLLGLGMFVLIFLYPLRKRWKWLGQQGSTKHWMDFHVMLGLTVPFVIAFHSSLKFRGFAGMAFWIMLAVSLSGVVGRYLYAQIPRRVTAAEMTLKELRDLQEAYTAELSAQRLIRAADLRALFRMPSEEQVARMPVIIVLAYMITMDLLRPWRIARLRRRTLTVTQSLLTLGGLLRSENIELEKAVDIARAQASLSKRRVFFARVQQVFHLWHVVHRPFSYSFVVLALIHIGVVWMFGYL